MPYYRINYDGVFSDIQRVSMFKHATDEDYATLGEAKRELLAYMRSHRDDWNLAISRVNKLNTQTLRETPAAE
jgi:hypothetical protein